MWPPHEQGPLLGPTNGDAGATLIVGVAQAGKVTITWLNWDTGTPFAAQHQKVIAEFNRQHPDIEVEMIQGPHADPSKFMVLKGSSRTIPDIIWVVDFEMGWYAHNDLLMDLNQFQAVAPVAIDKWFPVWRQVATVGGRLCGVPVDTAFYTIGYNADMLREAGVAVPDDEHWTWDDYMHIATKLTKRDASNRILQLGASLPAFNSWPGVGFLRSFGGYFATPTGDIGIDSPGSLLAYEFCRTFVQQIAGSPADWIASGRHITSPDFAAGHAAIYARVGSWDLSTYRGKIPFDWGILKQPKGPAGRFLSVSNTYYAIPKGAKYPAEAWELIRFLNSDWAVRFYAETGRMWPPTAHMLSSVYASTGLPPKMLDKVAVNQ